MIQNNNSEKHCISARRLRRIRSKKARKLLVCLTALLCMTLVSATVAFLVTETSSVKNTFQGSKVACAVIEDNSTSETAGIVDIGATDSKTNVKIKNTGDTTAYIRVAVVVNWMSADGTRVWATKPIEGTDYTISYDLTNGWFDGGDGYYYYSKPVSPDSSNNLTSVLIKEAKLNADVTVPVGTDNTRYYLSIEIVASAIQSTPTSVVTGQWSSVVIDKDGITLKRKTN